MIEKLTLLDEYQWPLDSVNDDGDSLLHIAAKTGDEELLDFCIGVGIDINATHHKSATSGLVTATATAISLGRTLCSYQIEITNEKGSAPAPPESPV